ncbi:MAG: DUF4097 domain-containing protein [Lachnospiraceae bacterium]|nr:DUF4097 domain-containing protein [Lachnospiraceae bacterium]
MKKTVYLTILSLVTVFCIIIGSIYHISGWIGFGLGGIFNFITNNDDSYNKRNQVEYSEDIKNFNNIKIDTDAMNIYIKEGNSYHLEYNCLESREPQFEVSGSTLEIKQPSARGWLRNHFNYKCELTITIPSGTALESADIITDVGNININNTKCKDFKAESDVGNIEIKSCAFEYSEIESDVGNIETSSSELGNTNIEADTGDVDVITCEFKDIEIYNDIGSVKLDNNKIDISNYTIDLSTDLGSIKFNGNKHKRSFYQVASGSSDTYKITIETDIGSITFN